MSVWITFTKNKIVLKFFFLNELNSIGLPSAFNCLLYEIYFTITADSMKNRKFSFPPPELVCPRHDIIIIADDAHFVLYHIKCFFCCFTTNIHYFIMTQPAHAVLTQLLENCYNESLSMIHPSRVYLIWRGARHNLNRNEVFLEAKFVSVVITKNYSWHYYHYKTIWMVPMVSVNHEFDGT